MKRRTIKASVIGSRPKSQIRRVVRAVHIVPGGSSVWEVRTLGHKRIRREFRTKAKAVDYARALSEDGRRQIIVHKYTPSDGSHMSSGPSARGIRSVAK